MQHVVQYSYTGGGETLSKSLTKTAGAEYNVDETVAQSQTDTPIAFALDVSQAVSIFIVSDQAMTLETNNGAAPAATITLAANVPKVWTADEAASRNPFGTTDVTALFATTGAIGAAGARLQMKILVDPTI